VKRLLKIAAAFIAASAAMSGLGLFLARRFERGEGYADADDFRIAAIWGGREFTSASVGLHSGWAVAVLGGISLDLRDATLDPAGASLALRATAGGISVTVPDDWRVFVEREVLGGAVEVRVPEPETLPEDAPTLHVSATVRSGGIVVTTREEG
jgi:hypothetical protein